MDELRNVDPTGEGQDFLESLLRESKEGEKLVDPRVGKHEEAMLSDATVEASDKGYRIELKWSGLTDTDGNPFDYIDRLFLPDEDAHVISKGKFMQKLKGLGVVPQSYKNVIYCNTMQGAMTLCMGIQDKCVGTSYPITITEDRNGFKALTVRARPKPKQN